MTLLDDQTLLDDRDSRVNDVLGSGTWDEKLGFASVRFCILGHKGCVSS